MLAGAGRLVEKLGLGHLRPEQPVRSLKAGEKQMVEIAKALINDPQIIFFDEPTASVSEKDAGIIFNIIEQLKKDSVAVVYISHRMPEIFRLSDEITVLKDGKTQGTFPAGSLTEDKLIQLMVGREMSHYEGRRRADQRPLLEAMQLSGHGFREISFTLHRGEILGMGGLIGAGRTEIAQAIFGVSRITGGSLRLKGKPVPFPAHPAIAIRTGIGYVPEDRKWLGIFEQRSVAENIYISELIRNPAFSSGRMNGLAQRYAEAFRIQTPSMDKKAGELSGGNQQKLLIARWLNMNVEVLIMDEPTQGIDIGARFEIYRIMREFADSGKGILLISSEMNELMNVCDRIMVIRQGSSMGVLEAAEASEERILSLAMP
jgi:ribose transport system ATP-binding protein